MPTKILNSRLLCNNPSISELHVHISTMVDLTVENMESLYEEEKILVEDVIWEEITSRSGKYSTKAKVSAFDSGEMLIFHGEYWGMRYSFTLRYKNTIIRLWDFNDHHEGMVEHKHRFPESEIIEEDPYPAEDVTTSDVNQAVHDFLEECNIRVGDVSIYELTGLTNYE